MARASSRRKRAVVDSSPELEDISADDFSLDEGNNLDDESEDDAEGLDENEEEYVSDGEDEASYQLEYRDDVDEDLELHDEPLQPVSDNSLHKYMSESSRHRQHTGPLAKIRNGSRKRQHTLFDEEKADEYDENESTSGTQDATFAADRKRTRRAHPSSPTMDADLMLTDEEQEYDPHGHPDVMKMTERQRARFLGLEDNGASQESRGHNQSNTFVELIGTSVAAPQGKPLPKAKETAEEAALRKSELARRRHDYKLKQLEGEKQDTLNKLLKRRATKTREVQGSKSTGEDGDQKAGSGLGQNAGLNGDEAASNLKPRRPTLHHAALFRYQSKIEGDCYKSNLSIPRL